jgi:hypothetical protein
MQKADVFIIGTGASGQTSAHPARQPRGTGIILNNDYGICKDNTIDDQITMVWSENDNCKQNPDEFRCVSFHALLNAAL